MLRVAVVDKRPQSPASLVSEAEIIFDGTEFGPLNGLKLVGFSVWRAPAGELYVTFPSRAFGNGSERRYFDYLRPADGPFTRESGSEVKAAIIEAVKGGGQ